MAFEIRVNNQPYTLWQTASVRRSIDTNCGVFSFSSSSELPPSSYPVKAGDAVQVLINGVPKATGFIDTITASQNENQHIITASGRDNTQDLIDSSVPDAAKVLEGPLSGVAFCESVINALGATIPVVNNSGIEIEFTDEDLLNADSGRYCMEFLTNFFRKKQVYLISDGNGRLSIFRPSGTQASGSIMHVGSPEDNVKNYSASWEHQNLFNTYRVRSQDNFGFNLSADYDGEGIDRTGDVIDNNIRTSRYLEVQGEETLFPDETNNRAQEEANVRRARAINYTATIQGTQQTDGNLWDIGLIVKVRDEFVGVVGSFLVRSIEYNQDVNDGTTTTMTFASPDAYTVRGVATGQDSRRANRGSRFENTEPSTTPRFSPRFAR